MQREIVTTIETWEAIKPRWKQLLQRIPNHNIFMTWEWQYYWWRHYAHRFQEAALRIATYYEENQLVAILPYFVYSESLGPFRLRKAVYLGSQIESSDYLDVIVAPNYRKLFLQRLEAELRSLFPEVDLIELNNCLSESIFYQAFAQHKNGDVFTETYRVCPYVQLPDSFDAYLKQLSSNFRYNIRRRVKKLTQKEGVRFQLWDQLENTDAVVAELFQLHSRRAQQKGLRTKFQPSVRLAFHQDVVRTLVPQGYIKLFHLISPQNQVIASMYCFDYDNTLAYFQAGFDPEWSNFSPGLVMLAKTIEYAIEKGYQIFDFMRGGESYKKNWGTVERYIYRLILSNSPRGTAYVTYYTYRKRMAPKIKHLLAKWKV